MEHDMPAVYSENRIISNYNERENQSGNGGLSIIYSITLVCISSSVFNMFLLGRCLKIPLPWLLCDIQKRLS